MKKLLLIGAVILAAITSQAQNFAGDVSQAVNDILDSPWAVGTGYGHSVTGTGNNVAYVTLADNFVSTTNATGTVGLSSGLLAGYDDLWSSHNSQFNSISGGFSVTLSDKPLTFIGTTYASNVCMNVSAYQLVANPKSGNDVGAITGVSVLFTLYDWKNFKFKVGGQYESRNGQGRWDGNYLLGSAFIAKSF
jgi:hypothetical protein